jgi:hypothetical protein
LQLAAGNVTPLEPGTAGPAVVHEVSVRARNNNAGTLVVRASLITGVLHDEPILAD